MHEYESIKELQKELPRMPLVQKGAFQSIRLSAVKELILDTKFRNCLFLGCQMDADILAHLQQDVSHGNIILPNMDVPFRLHLSKLYTASSIYKGYDLKAPESYLNTYDTKVYQHYMNQGGATAMTIYESLARTLHDHSVTDALHDFIRPYKDHHIVAIMGGHSLGRDTSDYRNVCLIAKALTEAGRLMISGGGPGAMEATHVGAWFAGRSTAELDEGLAILSTCPSYKNAEKWLQTSFQVMEQFPRKKKYESLGIPTWLYGHEPPTPFASRIAKYFSNALREDGLLAIAKGGIVFSPGSAGTIQEIFQDACQNHYLSYEYPSPMVFINKEYWMKGRPVYPFLSQMLEDGKYKNLLLSIYDTVEDVVQEILQFEGK